MPRSYASQFRRMVIEQVRSGRRVVEVARGVEVPEGTVFRWVRQDKIDRGEIPGTSTQESSELRAARRRIAELEAELATVKRASELFAPGPAQRAGGAREKSCAPSWRRWQVRAMAPSVCAGSWASRFPRSTTGATLRLAPGQSAGHG